MNQSKVTLAKFDASLGLDRGASKVKEMLWYIIKMLLFLTPFPIPSRFKVLILRLFGARVGHGVVLKPRINIHFPWKLVLGDHVWIGEEVFILNFESCTIASNVCVSQRAFLCGGNHDFRKPDMPYRNGPIILHEGCWVGAGAFVGPGVEIGTDTVITAGSIITGSVAGNGIYRGNPATLVGVRWKNDNELKN